MHCLYYIAYSIDIIVYTVYMYIPSYIWLIFMFVFTNLVILSKYTHEWYHCKFPAIYPKDRCRLIPLVW